MKTTIKILILILAVTCAIGGVMIYAKTKVAPPVSLAQINQYELDVKRLVSELRSAENAKTEDDVFAKAVDRIRMFSKEGKMTSIESDKSMDLFVNNYSSLFLKRSFASFDQSEWKNETHNYIISQSKILKGITHADSTPVLHKSAIDSLNLAASIISDYKLARSLSYVSTFNGYDSAKSAINKAQTYMNDPYLKKCKSLNDNLKNVKSRLAESCYNQVVEKIDELSNYRNYTKDYYDSTLVQQVDDVVTEYDNRAQSVFGVKKDVNVLWNRAQNIYKEAMAYYEANNY